MRILVVYQHYLLAGQPGFSRYNEFCRMWAEAGHDVTVLAGNMNYTTGEVPEEFRGRWMVHTQDGKVEVIRCLVPTTYRKGTLGRIWAFFGFMVVASYAALKVRRADVVISSSPPLTIAVPGWVAARVHRRSRLIFEIRDLWPETLIGVGFLRRRGVMARLLYALERWACRTADKINVLTPAFREDLLRRQIVPPEKIVFIPNGGDSIFTPPADRDGTRRRMGWENRTVALYAGAHGPPNALSQLLDAAEHLRGREDILIACVGDGIERQALEAQALERCLKNIRFYGPRPKEEMPALVGACDMGLAVLRRTDVFKTVYPNKVFDYMLCERPTVLAIDGTARELVCDAAKAGLFATPEDGQAIAERIAELADDPALRRELGENGRKWVLQNATRESLARQYETVMSELTSKGQQ